MIHENTSSSVECTSTKALLFSNIMIPPSAGFDNCL
jgi:hypothetical protein